MVRTIFYMGRCPCYIRCDNIVKSGSVDNASFAIRRRMAQFFTAVIIMAGTS